jgi:hypothetical protein
MIGERGPNRFLPVDEFPPGSRVPPLRSSLRRRCPATRVLLLGSVSGDGFRKLTYRDSLRDIEACLRSLGGKLYHVGFGRRVARSTLADANDVP